MKFLHICEFPASLLIHREWRSLRLDTDIQTSSSEFGRIVGVRKPNRIFSVDSKETHRFHLSCTGFLISTLEPEYVRSPVEMPSMQLLANQAGNDLSHIKFYIRKLVFLTEQTSSWAINFLPFFVRYGQQWLYKLSVLRFRSRKVLGESMNKMIRKRMLVLDGTLLDDWKYKVISTDLCHSLWSGLDPDIFQSSTKL